MPKTLGIYTSPERRKPLRPWLLGITVFIALVIGLRGASVARANATRRLQADLRIDFESQEGRLPRTVLNGSWVPDVLGNTGTTRAESLVYQRLLVVTQTDDLAPLCHLFPVFVMYVGNNDVQVGSAATCAGFLGRTWSTQVNVLMPLALYPTR
jgi:hypothetical protein